CFAPSESDIGLKVNVIRVSGAERRSGERLLDIIADEEMAIADFQLCETRQSISGNDIQFCSYEVAIGRVYTIASAGADVCCHVTPATRHPCDVIKIVVRVGQPEAVAFNGDTQARNRLELKNAPQVLNILQ